ncbi:MAG: iron-siderophore ABC transporter substrate-binding protein [Leptolyngbyaceae bacterium]|nr:iron-siderophore ABC transporter substrate-binding protein [Leptolyngbyaceae bacterium]
MQKRKRQVGWRFLLGWVFVLGLAACTGQSASDSTPQTHCRTISHALGETCVPPNPERVIVLDTSPLDVMFELGLQPIATPDLGDILSYSEEQLAGIESLGSNEQPNLEGMLQLKPDLILATPFDAPKIYDELSQIAPTVVAPSGNVDWKEDLRIYAAALGKTDEAEALLTAYEGRVQEFQQRMGDRLSKTEVAIVSFANYGPGLPVRVYLSESFMGQVVEETGLSRPPGQRDRTFSKELSIERLDIADGDVIFFMEFDPQEGLLEKVQQHPLWSQLEAVEQERIYPVNYGSWVAERNIGGANRILDDLFQYLVKEAQM